MVSFHEYTAYPPPDTTAGWYESSTKIIRGKKKKNEETQSHTWECGYTVATPTLHNVIISAFSASSAFSIVTGMVTDTATLGSSKMVASAG